MGERSKRSPVAAAAPFTIVPASDDEEPEYWLLRDGRDDFPLHLAELHDLMDAIEAFHDAAHPH